MIIRIEYNSLFYLLIQFIYIKGMKVILSHSTFFSFFIPNAHSLHSNIIFILFSSFYSYLHPFAISFFPIFIPISWSKLTLPTKYILYSFSYFISPGFHSCSTFLHSQSGNQKPLKSRPRMMMLINLTKDEELITL